MSCTVERPGLRRGDSLRCWYFAGSLLVAGCCLGTGWKLGAAEEAKAEPKPSPPRVLMAMPLSVSIGETNRITVRGLNLTNASSARVIGPDGATQAVSIQSRGTANPIDGFDLQRVGDQKLELEFALDSSFASGTNNRIVLASPAGESPPFPMFATRPEKVVSEKEPNNAFRDASVASSGMIIRGAIEAAGDVDVFQFEVEPGDKLRAEIFAERLGSTLDAALSLYDHTGNLVAQSDDALGRDPRIEWVATKLEAVRIVISSVNEKAAASHQYLLKIESAKAAH